MLFLDQITQSIDDNVCVDVVYLDFAKTFDKVPHSRKLEKLEKHGIGGKLGPGLELGSVIDVNRCV